MNNVISFTPTELVGFITAIGGAIVTIGAVITLIFKLVNRVRAPEIKQNERIKAVEDRLKAIEEQNKIFTQYFINDDKRFKAIERSNKITQSALLAILKHSINGQDIESLKKAEKSIEEFLIEK